MMASLLIAKRKSPKLLVLLFGSMGVIGLLYGCLENEGLTIYLRIYGICFFYLTLMYILIRNFLDSKKISLQVVMGAVSGYLVIGFIGASTIEMMDFHHPGSFGLSDTSESFDYYYFSFISLVTVGYGDIVPLSSAAKSLTIFISVIGQFYMAVGIASFVGKFMSK